MSFSTRFFLQSCRASPDECWFVVVVTVVVSINSVAVTMDLVESVVLSLVAFTTCCFISSILVTVRKRLCSSRNRMPIMTANSPATNTVRAQNCRGGDDEEGTRSATFRRDGDIRVKEDVFAIFVQRDESRFLPPSTMISQSQEVMWRDKE